MMNSAGGVFGNGKNNAQGVAKQELSFGPRLPPSGTANFRPKHAVGRPSWL